MFLSIRNLCPCEVSSDIESGLTCMTAWDVQTGHHIVRKLERSWGRSHLKSDWGFLLIAIWVSRGGSFSPIQPPDDCDLMRALKRELARWAALKFLSIKNMEIINNSCYFKPLNFGIFCYRALGNWYSWGDVSDYYTHYSIHYLLAIESSVGIISKPHKSSVKCVLLPLFNCSFGG